jgi:hypothetical protein
VIPASPLCITSQANASETTAVPANFCSLVSPSDRWRLTFVVVEEPDDAEARPRPRRAPRPCRDALAVIRDAR